VLVPYRTRRADHGRPEALSVSEATISRDLAGSNTVLELARQTDGRRKGAQGNSKSPEWQALVRGRKRRWLPAKGSARTRRGRSGVPGGDELVEPRACRGGKWSGYTAMVLADEHMGSRT
jgi:hypothetical protein